MKTKRSLVGPIVVGITVIAVFGIACRLLLPARCGAPEAPDESTCEWHLVRLGESIARYRKEKGDLPQAIVGPGGFKCGWRALIVPYRLSDIPNSFDYRLGESWDSPHNHTQFRKWAPCLFTCPSEAKDCDYPFVSYLMLVRSNSTKPDRDRTTSLPDDAVLIVESARCKIEYGEPKDLYLEDVFQGDSPFSVGKLSSLHRNVVKALRVDGKVIDIPTNISKDDLRKLLQGRQISK